MNQIIELTDDGTLVIKSTDALKIKSILIKSGNFQERFYPEQIDGLDIFTRDEIDPKMDELINDYRYRQKYMEEVKTNMGEHIQSIQDIRDKYNNGVRFGYTEFQRVPELHTVETKYGQKFVKICDTLPEETHLKIPDRTPNIFILSTQHWGTVGDKFIVRDLGYIEENINLAQAHEQEVPRR